jgi:hypothetical protein
MFRLWRGQLRKAWQVQAESLDRPSLLPYEPGLSGLKNPRNLRESDGAPLRIDR